MVQKVCFVTIGATADFDPLLRAVLSPSFLQALHTSAYTSLLLQYGSSGKLILKEFEENATNDHRKSYGIEVTGFDFNKQGLSQEMRAVKGGNGTEEGIVISHAGLQQNNSFLLIESSRDTKALARFLTLFVSQSL